MKRIYALPALVLSATLLSCSQNDDFVSADDLDKTLLQTLEISSKGVGKNYYKLPDSEDFSAIPQDPKNPITNSKVELGKLLFHETGLGQNPVNVKGMSTYSCSSCHHAKAGFQACVPQGMGEGGAGFGIQGEGRVVAEGYTLSQVDVQPIRTPSAMNMAYQSNVLWNGQFGATHLNEGTQTKWTKGTPKEKNNLGFEGVETQAIAGRDVHRLLIDKIFISNIATYKDLYTKAFDESSLQDPVKLKNNGALAIAAYERTLLANKAPFQQWIRGDLSAMTDKQKEGANLFFGKAGCVKCHNGPALANMEFYGLGMDDLQNGNYGNNQVININNGQPEHLGRGGFTGNAQDNYKFKVPQLYNLKDSPFYGHGAQFKSVKEVIEYKNKAIASNQKVPKTQLAAEFKPLNLSSVEIEQLTDFIENALRDPDLFRYVPSKLPSGLAFPNNDYQSRRDLGY